VPVWFAAEASRPLLAFAALAAGKSAPVCFAAMQQQSLSGKDYTKSISNSCSAASDRLNAVGTAMRDILSSMFASPPIMILVAIAMLPPHAKIAVELHDFPRAGL
jgi:hypothetical protein